MALPNNDKTIRFIDYIQGKIQRGIISSFEQYDDFKVC